MQALISDIFFFNDTATTEIYTLSLHDALPISGAWFAYGDERIGQGRENAKQFLKENEEVRERIRSDVYEKLGLGRPSRSEEHTSELQSRQYLVCRLLLEKKKNEVCTVVYQIID